VLWKILSQRAKKKKAKNTQQEGTLSLDPTVDREIANISVIMEDIAIRESKSKEKNTKKTQQEGTLSLEPK